MVKYKKYLQEETKKELGFIDYTDFAEDELQTHDWLLRQTVNSVCLWLQITGFLFITKKRWPLLEDQMSENQV